MGCVYKRGHKLWIKFKDARGKWQYTASGYAAGQEPSTPSQMYPRPQFK